MLFLFCMPPLVIIVLILMLCHKSWHCIALGTSFYEMMMCVLVLVKPWIVQAENLPLIFLRPIHNPKPSTHKYKFSDFIIALGYVNAIPVSMSTSHATNRCAHRSSKA